ncbi:MAG: low molecular weight phosphotyrosine protein phosphatase [Epsilonproteobacteria bacterium]|nr:MAG: low molecular weight phosphotyrosine protein phosphatase [Campylobacterota bacterium]
MKSVLFVCLGNICRSPLAEGIAKQIVSERGLDILIDSAGTGNWHSGETPCENSIVIAKSRGVDISQQHARQITEEDASIFDLVIALDQSNYNDLKKLGIKKLRKLGEFGANNDDIPDPYFFPGYEGFEKVYEMIELCVINLFDELPYKA